MKKVMFGLSILLFTPVFPHAGEGNKITVLSSEEVDSVRFHLDVNENSNLHVSLAGVYEDLASISVVDMRGKTLFYKFVDKSNMELDIDLSGFDKGAYYVKLNLNSEIRMKVIRVED
jgi:hypothetical protein